MPKVLAGSVSSADSTDLVLKNKSPFLSWFCGLCVYAFMVEMTWIFVRDGGFHTLAPHMEVFALMGSWIIGVCFLVVFLQKKYMKTVLKDGKVTIQTLCLMPLYRDIEKFDLEKAKGVYFISDPKPNGEKYYRCELMTPKGKMITLSEGNIMPDVKAVHDRVYFLSRGYEYSHSS